MKFKKACMSLLSILFINSNSLCSIAMNVPKKVLQDDDKCNICLECLKNGKELITTKCCNNFIHKDCLCGWIVACKDNEKKKEGECPLCREKIDKEWKRSNFPDLFFCLRCKKPFDPNDQTEGHQKIEPPCGHPLHLNCLMIYKDGGIYESYLGIIGGRKCYCWLTRQNKCPICDEHLPSWFLKEINKDNSDSEYDSYDDE